MKRPTPEQIIAAAESLEAVKGQGTKAQACHAVAAWLRSSTQTGEKIPLSLSLYSPQIATLHALASALRDDGLRFNRSLAFRAALKLADGCNEEELRCAYEAGAEGPPGEDRQRVSLSYFAADEKRASAVGDRLLTNKAPTVDDSIIARTVLSYVRKPTRQFLEVARELAGVHP